MQKWMLSLTAVLAIGFVSLALAGPGKDKGDKMKMAGPMPGDQAPAFTLTDQSGKSVTLSNLSGKVVVLEWFNNECPYVIKHYKTGHMNELASQYADKGVVWLAVNSTSVKTADDMKTVSTDWKIDRPILLDAASEVRKHAEEEADALMTKARDDAAELETTALRHLEEAENTARDNKRRSEEEAAATIATAKRDAEAIMADAADRYNQLIRDEQDLGERLRNIKGDLENALGRVPAPAPAPPNTSF